MTITLHWGKINFNAEEGLIKDNSSKEREAKSVET